MDARGSKWKELAWRPWRGLRSWALLDRSALLVAAGVLALAAASGSMVGLRGYRYAWVDPVFCDTCHVHDYALRDWRNSVHGGLVTCHDCHRVPLVHYVKTLFHTVYDRPSFPEDLHELPRIPSESCETCHMSQGVALADLSSPMPASLFAATVKIESSPSHQVHLLAKDRDPGLARGGAGGGERRMHRLARHGADAAQLGLGTGVIECMDCHGTEANRFHNFAARWENCVQCHEELALRGHVPDFDCRHCHFQDFLAPGDLGTTAWQPLASNVDLRDDGTALKGQP